MKMMLIDMGQYIYESIISMGILYLLYRLLFRGETYFHFNRYYLIFSVLFSMIIPLFNIPILHTTQNSSGLLPQLVETIRLQESRTTNANITEEKGIDYSSIILVFYLLVSIFLLGRTLLGIIRVRQLKNNGKAIYYKGYTVVYTNLKLSPFSFFKTIFLNPEYISKKDEAYVLSHEYNHIRQAHSLDKLLLEVLGSIYWFNPFIWLIKKDIEILHEYLADRETVLQHKDVHYYQKLLFSQLGNSYPLSATNNFSSIIKNRITMITKKRSSISSRIKTLIIAPVMMLLLFVFASSEINSQGENISLAENMLFTQAPDTIPDKQQDTEAKEEEEVFAIVDNMPLFNNQNANKAFPKYVQENIHYPEKAKENGISGKVYAQFTVNKKGKIEDLKIIRSVDPLLDKEAFRVINNSPDWTPGSHKGKPVNVKFTYPVVFVLD